ncbi:MAG: glycosyl transferase group 1, partial [Spartobacteria bacterium]|nr:glycosyl transferase group 1 [Spartobacteria bacterium]
FGNANVRAILEALNHSKLLNTFVTTVGWSAQSYPYLSDHIRGKLRRNYQLPADKIDIHPMRESVRLLAGVFGATGLTQHETGWASIDQVWQSLDREGARRLRRNKYGPSLRAVYAYEDCAEQLFLAARDLGFRRIYDLPIAHWTTTQRLLREEAERYPDWEPTLGGTRDSKEKLSRKSRELALAELVICPSRFVMESLPEEVRGVTPCIVAPFGSPILDSVKDLDPPPARPLRVLFAGAMTQRKGLADLFAAMKLLKSSNVELVVMGSTLCPIHYYRERCASFIYEPPRPNRDVLRLMQTCDIFVLPSIVEGRALVQQEAMACGLPLIATKNAGADDLIVEGETGFLVPIRSPEKIAEKIDWFAMNRSRLGGMGIAAQRRARDLTWRSYGETVVGAIRGLLNK